MTGTFLMSSKQEVTIYVIGSWRAGLSNDRCWDILNSCLYMSKEDVCRNLITKSIEFACSEFTLFNLNLSIINQVIKENK